MNQKTILVVSGLDPTGGAGLLADVSTIEKEKVHALGIPTALTVQTGKKVISVKRIPYLYFRNGLRALGETFRIGGVKIGMISSSPIAREIYRFLIKKQIQSVVLDPVFFSSYGTPLFSEKATALLEKIIPLCTLVTPNRQELRQLASMFGIKGNRSKVLGENLSRLTGTSILLTGGQEKDKGTDYLFSRGYTEKFPGNPIRGKNFHGTGCALSSLVVAHLVKGHGLDESIGMSKEILEERLRSGFRSIDGRWFIGL